MMTFIKAIFFIFLALLVMSGVFALLGTALGLTFGVIGTAFSVVWKIVTNPVALVLLIIFLVYKLGKASPSK